MIDIEKDQASLVLNALPHAVIMVDVKGYIISANWGAEVFPKCQS